MIRRPLEKVFVRRAPEHRLRLVAQEPNKGNIKLGLEQGSRGEPTALFGHGLIRPRPYSATALFGHLSQDGYEIA